MVGSTGPNLAQTAHMDATGTSPRDRTERGTCWPQMRCSRYICPFSVQPVLGLFALMWKRDEAVKPSQPSSVVTSTPAKDREVAAESRTPAAPRTSSVEKPAQPKIFLCYRRDDTEYVAHRLHAHLVDSFGRLAAFLDADSIPLGVDFVEHIQTILKSCSAVIVLIGRDWLDVRDHKGKRRLDDPNDHVRTEIITALKLGVPVIPVLVQNVSMPDADELPTEIRPLVRRNGIHISATQWKNDVERLVGAIRRDIIR